MSELILELFSEEIPAMMQQQAIAGYKIIFEKYFKQHEISHGEINLYATPRRITLHVQDLPASLPSCSVELKGPKVGAPEKAIQGFCAANNISPDLLQEKEIKGMSFFVYNKEKPEQMLKDILQNSLAEPIAEYVWPKSMYWSDNKIKWVRPLQNILCVFDGDALEFEYGHLKSHNLSFGHRFMAPDSFEVSNFKDYQAQLEKQYVILDFAKRQEYIKNELQKAADKLNLDVKDDPKLLEEVTGLVEYPQIMTGRIDQQFLSVPSDILVSAMRLHQKYFSLFEKNDNSKFAPYFLFVSNIAPEDDSVIISGNEKVLSARLADALYFYNQDLKTTLQQKSKKLEKVIFHASLGTLKEKTLRLEKLSKYLAPDDSTAQQAALVCKGDIVSEVVDEFSNLQGVMGYYYAKAEGLQEQVAVAVRDHYKPQGPADRCPESSAAIVALADKIDSLCGLMIAGEKPTGSKDPFALRRQALGIIRIILENNLSLDLVKLVEFALNNYGNQISFEQKQKDEIISFIEERIKHFFKSEFDHNIIAGVLNLKNESDLNIIKLKLEALQDFLKTQDGDALLSLYKRASNIIKDTDLAGKKVNESLFASEHEINLFKATKKINSEITELVNQKDFPAALTKLLGIKKEMANFFDNIMVKDENLEVAENRMILLNEVKKIFALLADFQQV